jgi:hypothetical protein
LMAGIQIYNMSHIDQVFCSTVQKNYGFGSTITQTVMTCQSLLFASVPLKFYYAADQNHLIGLGINAGYLLSAKNTTESFRLSDGVPVDLERKESYGLYQGLSSTNFILTASILKHINSKFSAQLELNYGLSDLFKNTSENNNLQNTSGVRLSLNYRLLNK